MNPEFTIMKKLLGILTIVIATVIATPSADARHYHRPSRHYVEYHRSCGGPAWVEHYVAYYDSCGHPVFRTRIIPVHRHRHHHRHVVVRPGFSVHIGGGCR